MSAAPVAATDRHPGPAATAASTVDDRFGVGPDTVQTQWGPITPATISASHPDPARRMLFYTGVGHPHHLNHTPVPLFISATTLARHRSRGPGFPVRMTAGGWAGDSGAHTALTGTSPDHPWHLDPDLFGGMWVRFVEDVGPPDFVAIQDWPCEPAARARTGLTVRQHQQYTLDSYLYLAEQFPMVPWIPVLQGWHAWQYEQHADMYEQAGIVLADCARVGLGSVCRRGSDTDVADLVTRLAARGFRLHGFGVSITGLRRIGHLLASSDSQAWSRTARTERIRLPGCRHHRRPDPTGVRHPTDCRNCFRYALHYREQVLDAVRLAATRARHDMTPLFELPATARTMPARPTRAGAPRPGPAHPGQLALFDPSAARQHAAPSGRAGVTNHRVTGHRTALPARSMPLPAVGSGWPATTRPSRDGEHR